MSVRVVDLLEEAVLEASQFGQFLAKSFQLLIEVDVGAEFEKDTGGAYVGHSTALGHFLFVRNDVDLGAFTQSGQEISLALDYSLGGEDIGRGADVGWQIDAGSDRSQ